MATTPNVVDVYPAPSASGIPLGDQIRIIFDQEMDQSSINLGTLVLSGPDDAPVFGPTDVTPFDEPGFDDEDILSSPYFSGYVKGTISFSKTDASGGLVDDDIEDTDGSGDLWRTVAIFTPEKPLKSNVEYSCMILGDEAPTDDFDTGVTTRTVFDTIFTGSGTGLLSFNGGYTGSETRTYIIEITSGGSTGNAEYIWWKTSDALTTYSGITSTGARELEDGIYALCDSDGSFTAGDRFQVVVIPALVLPNNYRWTFTTGSGSILTPPSSSSASGVLSTTPELEIVSITPKDKATHLDPESITEIVIVFNQDVDPSTITDENITIWTEPTNGNMYDENIEYDGVFSKVLNVSGNTVTIQIV